MVRKEFQYTRITDEKEAGYYVMLSILRKSVVAHDTIFIPSVNISFPKKWSDLIIDDPMSVNEDRAKQMFASFVDNGCHILDVKNRNNRVIKMGYYFKRTDPIVSMMRRIEVHLTDLDFGNEYLTNKKSGIYVAFIGKNQLCRIFLHNKNIMDYMKDEIKKEKITRILIQNAQHDIAKQEKLTPKKFMSKTKAMEDQIKFMAGLK